MSTIKSSAENLTLNADGANNDIKFQSNGSEVASIDQAGTITATTFTGAATDATKLPLAGGTMTGALDLNHSINVSHNSGVAAIIANSAASQLALRLDQTNSSEPYGMVIDFSAAAKNNTTNYFILCEDSSAAKFKVFSSGQVQTPSILFGSDTAAANALDDYETGTWTPNLSVKPSGVALSTVTAATYTKIGDRVFISLQCLITSSSVPAPNNDMRIIGFPFANANSGVNMPATFNYNYKQTPGLFMNGNGYFYYQDAAVGGNNQSPAGSGLDASTTLSLAIQYKTNS